MDLNIISILEQRIIVMTTTKSTKIGSGDLRDDLVTIKPGDPSINLYCFFFNSGDISDQYRDIAYALPGRVRVLGIGRPGCKYFCTIEDYALDAAERIGRVQKEGPFYLTGFCFGGLIALKTALILEKRGYQVSCCLIDIPYHRKRLRYYLEYGLYFYLVRNRWLYSRLKPKVRTKLRRYAKRYNYKTLWKKDFYFKGPCVIFLGEHMVYRDSYKGYEQNLAGHFQNVDLFFLEDHHHDMLCQPGSSRVAEAISQWFY